MAVTTYPVECGFCGVKLAVATHKVRGIYCADNDGLCADRAQVGKRPLRLEDW